MMIDLKSILIAVGNICHAAAGYTPDIPEPEERDWADEKDRLPRVTRDLLDIVEGRKRMTIAALAKAGKEGNGGLAQRIELLIYGGFVELDDKIISISDEYEGYADQNTGDRTVHI